MNKVEKFNFKFILIIILMLFAGNASSSLVNDKTADGYSACSWTSNGDGTSLIKVTIKYKYANSAGAYWWSRGVLLYSYKKDGTINSYNMRAKRVKLNDISSGLVYNGGDYIMYTGYVADGKPVASQWNIKEPFDANFEILIDDSIVQDWPAISVQAGNFTSAWDVAEITGGAYISRYGADGACEVVDPIVPPAPTIGIEVTAPDWDLGELPAGNGEKVFSNRADQLCFDYKGAGVNNKRFVINASGVNGQVENRYRLRSLEDPAQEVPYDIKLDSGSNIVNLPNINNAGIALDGSGKTCFVPTFHTTVDKLLEPGDYSDVLTFTVVTKP
ncbi:hypothetical protein [Burkholderia sp. Ac-20392]|uniref:hypothetical protein n=1 Tax=Burkholderia sp. Ac-20392 TaxID=2703905 RepID=UPI001980C47A|nr:hypothetical protein [Burkholderia sp. Ac-20392]MBN3794105.1 hypothetical protein [Burkholderia sp. Ac-20392]